MKKTLILITLITLFFGNTQAQNWNEIIKTVASDRGVDDEFGYSVAISGNYAIVGTPYEDEDVAGLNTLNDAGSAYIFERNGAGIWTEVEKLVASDRGAADQFGYSVAISGDYAIVGARREDHDEVGFSMFNNSGSSYVFERNVGGVWNQVQKIVASDRGIDDEFGYSVAIFGDYIVVGAPLEDEDANGLGSSPSKGSAYIFERSVGGIWNEVQKVVANNLGADDKFGWSVSISGDFAIVGAPYEDHDAVGQNMLFNAGSAYVFRRYFGGNWLFEKKLVASVREVSDHFGFSVAISGNHILIGAEREDHDAAGLNFLNHSGSVYVFESGGFAVWNQVQKLVASDRGGNDRFGWSVAISGDYAIVGAAYEDENVAGISPLSNAGSAYIFEKNALGFWNEVEKLVASDRGVDDEFGYSVAISGTNALLGARHEDQDTVGLNTMTDAGSAYIFAFCLSTISSFNVTMCTSYTVPSGDETYIAVGTYSVMDTLPNSCGKDSVMTITLTILPALTGSVTTTLCNESNTDFIVNGTTYNVANPIGTEVFANVGPNNCDSTVIINLNVLPAKTGSFTNTICNYDSVIVNGTTYSLGNPTGTEVFTNVGPNSCDSTVTINLNVLPVLTGSVTNFICNEGSIVVNGTTYNAGNPSGVEVFANCDSTVTINLTVLPSKTGSVTNTICNEESILVNGTVYNAANPTGTEVITNVGPNNCDSTVTISLNVLPALTGSVTTTICNEGSVIVNGTTYNVGNSTGTEVFTNIGPNNCDSVVTINLTILPALTSSITTTLCNESVANIIVNGTTYNTANPTGTEVFPNIGPNNCDSVVSINLNVLPAKIGNVTNTICNHDSIIVNGTTYNAANPSGTELFTNVGPNNCDSTVTIALNVLPVLTGSVTNTICNEGSIIVNGTTYNAANPSGTEVFANCDSTVTINLNVLPALTGSVTAIICNEESIVVNGTTYNAVNPTGIEIITNVGPYNCDSTVTINLTVLPALTGSVTTAICNEDNVIVNSTTYNAANPSGTEVFSNIGPNNCDSTVTINLNVLPLLTGSVTTTICNEDTVFVNGTAYHATNSTGTEIFMVGANNCDSMVTVNLTVNTAIDTSTTINGLTITSNQTGATYQWINCTNGNVIITGETNASYTATTNGDYAVVVTVGNCSDTSACVNINTVGVHENGLSNELRIYPNPTNGLFTVSLAQLEKDARIKVYSVLGQQIISKIITSNQTEIDLRKAEKGIYFFQINNGIDSYSGKIVVQ